MSYCVQCGVKLADSEKVCPLCNTRVINPNDPEGENSAARPYPERVEEQIRGLNRRELGWLVSIFFAVPAGATIVIDLLTELDNFGLSWSLYVAAALAMMFVWVAIPLLLSKINVYAALMLDSAAAAGLLAVIAWQTDRWRWCTHLGIPLALLTGVMACVMALVIRARRLRPLTRASICCLVLGAFIIFIEFDINFAAFEYFGVRWSIYAAVPLLCLALLIFYIGRKPGLINELRKRLFT